MKNKTILLVEDNPDDVELTQIAFQRNHITNPMVVARDGAEALELLQGRSDHAESVLADLPAIVLLDLKLPKADGLEVLRQIRSHPRTRLLPVVVLTSSKEEQDLIKSYSLGCNSYVHKPVSFEEFLEAARLLGLYWLLLNEAPPTQRHE
jgi:two-component system response regulator